MSKGFGKVQKAILEALEHDNAVVLRHLPYSQPAVSRAAYKLGSQGLVKVWWAGINTDCLYPDWDGNKKKRVAFRRFAIAARPGTSQADLQEFLKRYR